MLDSCRKRYIRRGGYPEFQVLQTNPRGDVQSGGAPCCWQHPVAVRSSALPNQVRAERKADEKQKNKTNTTIAVRRATYCAQSPSSSR